jgi:hypothetical protein
MEDWLSFGRIIWLLPLPSASCLFLNLPLCRRLGLLTGEGGGGGAKSYDGEKVWSSIDKSILSASRDRYR